MKINSRNFKDCSITTAELETILSNTSIETAGESDYGSITVTENELEELKSSKCINLQKIINDDEDYYDFQINLIKK